MLNVIKDYLVAIGFKVDDASYKKSVGQLAAFDKAIKTHTSSWSKSYVMAASAITSAIGSISAATVGLMDTVAQADLGYKKFAMRMYMTEDAAKRLKIVTDAMGESLDDIAWNPELRERYFRLMEQTRQLEGGGDDTFRKIRDIREEYTRLKIELTYGMQHVVARLGEKLGLGGTKNWLKEINDKITKNLPVWSNNIATFLSLVIRLGKVIFALFEKIYDWMKSVIDQMFPYQEAWQLLGNAISFVWDVLKRAFEIAKKFVDVVIESGTFRMFAALLTDIFSAIDSIVKGLKNIFRLQSEHEDQISFWDYFARGVNVALQAVLSLSRALAGVFTILGQIAQGDFTGAFSTAKYIWENLKTDAKNAYNYLAKGPEAIKQTESGGNYGAVNKFSGARGAYQIMPSNWAPWSKEAGLGENSPMNKENQDIVASFKYDQYMKKYRDERLVAAAWYAGPGYADSLMRGKPLYDPNRAQANNHPSVNEYIRKVTGNSWDPGDFGGGGNATTNNNNVAITINAQGKDTRGIADEVGKVMKKFQNPKVSVMILQGGVAQ